MRILIEEHPYPATDEIVNVVSELGPTIGVKGTVSVGYVGYYYNTRIHDCVFILPKVLLDENGLAMPGKHRPEDIVHLEKDGNPLDDDQRRFIYELSVWIYRAICVFKERNKDSKIVLHERMAQIGHGQRRLSNTFLDILFSLIQFNRDNQDFFFFTIKNLHSGHNKINWTKTIAHSQAYMQNGQPIYLSPVNKRRQVNFDEELMVIYFSILNYIHKEYGFPMEMECHYSIINDHQFKSFMQMGKARLQQIKYKYFSDKALELWDLCFAFFDEARQISVNTKQKEYLLVKNFEKVFEDIIDELIGGRKNELPKELQDQPDGKQVDHMYRYKALTDASNENIYYIGDSKYYKSDTKIGKEALYKQFTYARNVVQWNLDLFLDDSRKTEQEEEERQGTGKLRDEETEGYNIIPNFFISAQQRDLRISDDISWIDKKNKEFTSRQFHNRLFDRDTLLVCHYDVNFLYVVSLYGRKNEGMKSAWRNKVRSQFRKEIQAMLDYHFQFYVMTPREHVDGTSVLQQNFKVVLGKVFQPYTVGDNGQRYYSLALENPATISDEKLKKAILEENDRVKGLLEQYFEIRECKLGEDRRNELPKYIPDGVIYANEEELVLLITKEGVNFDNAIEQIQETKKVGIALKMDGAVLQLVEGFTKAKYLVIHNKGSKYKVYGFDGKGPKLIPSKVAEPMVVTKKDEELYLVYQVDTRLHFYLGELDLGIVAKGGDGYSPQLLPLERLLKRNGTLKKII